MSYSISLQTPLSFGYYFRGYTGSGNPVALIGVDALGRVAVDPNGVGADIGGNVLFLNPAAYLNWDTTIGAGGYGIRGNAGTIEFKNSAGAWAPIAAAAASAGGWTDDGTVVRLDTGTDQVGIGTTTPLASTKLHVASADVSNAVSFTGVTKGVRIGFNSVQAWIDAIDSATGATFQPLQISSSQLGIYLVSGEVTRFLSTGLVVNDTGADYDFRIESDTNTNHYNSDAGAMTGVGSHAFGTTVTSNTYFRIGAPALTQGANNDFYAAMIYPAGAVTIPAGTAAIVASLYVQEPNIVATGTVSDAYTVVITGAPTEGTRNGALWTNGQLRCSGLPTSAAGLPAGSLWNNSGVVNIV